MVSKDPKEAALFVARVAATCGSQLRAYLLRRLRAGEDAGDLEQEVYLRLLRWGKGEEIREPMAYVYHVARQVIAEERLRNTARPVAYESEVLDRLANADGIHRRDELQDQEHTRREIRGLLAKLSSLHRSVYLMKKRDGFSVEEIAKHLNISIFKVRRYLVEANAKLEEKIRQGGLKR